MVLDEPKDDDERVELDGLIFLISQTLSAQCGLVKVDFIEKGWQQGLAVSSEKPLSAGADPAAGCGGSCSC